jgi:hypothetical protein
MNDPFTVGYRYPRRRPRRSGISARRAPEPIAIPPRPPRPIFTPPPRALALFIKWKYYYTRGEFWIASEALQALEALAVRPNDGRPQT